MLFNTSCKSQKKRLTSSNNIFTFNIMGAPIGNQFWKLRSKHGRDKLFKTPELLWNAACEYFDWCDNNPLKAEELIKTKVDRDCEEVNPYQLNKMRPYTIQGLCMYCDASTSYWREFKSNLDKTKQIDKEFLSIATRIEEIIYHQKFEGAASGFFNANIIARDLGLQDKKELEHSGSIEVSRLTPEQREKRINELREKLNK